MGEARVVSRGGGSQAAGSAQAGAAPGAGDARGGGRKPKYNPVKKLRELETQKILTGKDLAAAANSLTVLETRPQIQGYARLANQLGQEREAEAKGLGRLGSSLQKGVGSVYKGIAESEAQSLAQQQAIAGQLNQTSANISKEGMANLATMQNTQTQGVADALAARGAPGGGTAQQELAAAVAAQKASQSANSQASQQFAAQQGAGYGQLAQMLAGATQQQGGAAVGGIGQTVIGRIAKSGREYGADIREARAKQAEAVASRGAAYNKNLLALRKQEQDYGLGKAAVRGEKAQRHLEREESAKDRALKERENATENRQWAKEYGLKKWEAEHPNAGSNKRAEKRAEIKEDVREVKSVIPTAVAAAKASGGGGGLESYIAYVNTKTSAPPQLVRKVVTKWWNHAGKQGNRGVPGVPQTPYK